MQNPHLIGGKSYFVYPKIGKILVMLDKDGDENYQPMLIPIMGGYPEPSFYNFFENYRVHPGEWCAAHSICYLSAESRREPMNESFKGVLASGELVKLAQSQWGANIDSHNKSHTKVTIIDGYTVGDNVLYIWEKKGKNIRLVYGVPLEERKPDQAIPLNAINSTQYTRRDRGLIFVTALFDDAMSLGYLRFKHPSKIKPVSITGIKHKGKGELHKFSPVRKNRYLLEYNIDGSSWLYEGEFDEDNLKMHLGRAIIGKAALSNGVLESVCYDKESDAYILSYSTATAPTQIFTVEGKKKNKVVSHTQERVLGIPDSSLSSGEDASFTSYDGIRVSARLYLPTAGTNFETP